MPIGPEDYKVVPPYRELTCKKCGWVHFGVSRFYAENEVARFNEYFDRLSTDDQNKYYGGKGSSIASYERCGLCGGSYTNFRPSLAEDSPDGCTLSPIIYPNE